MIILLDREVLLDNVRSCRILGRTIRRTLCSECRQ